MESVANLFSRLLPTGAVQNGIDELQNGQRVTSNAVILRNIFGYLGASDLISCRLVCTLWEETSKLQFEKKAKIKIELQAFEQFYKEYNTSKLRLATLEMCKCYQYSGAFVKFFQVKFEFIRSLSLENVLLFDMRGTIKEFNLSPSLGATLTSLTINSSKNTTMVLCQWNLVAVKYLNLTWCKVLVRDSDSQIQPNEIYLKNVRFCDHLSPNSRESFYLDSFPLWSQSFLNCDKLTTARVTNLLGDIFYTIDVDEKSKRYVNLVLKNFNFWYGFIDTGDLPVRKLTMNGIMNGFLWTYLPQSLQVLVFDVYRDLPDPIPGCLPNLKELKCKLRGPLSFTSWSFHTKLANVQIESYYPFIIDCDVSWLPPSVTELHLDKINPTWSDNFEHQLQSLTIVNFPLLKVFSILKKLKTNDLYFSFQYFPSSASSILKFICWVLKLPVNNVSVVPPLN